MTLGGMVTLLDISLVGFMFLCARELAYRTYPKHDMLRLSGIRELYYCLMAAKSEGARQKLRDTLLMTHVYVCIYYGFCTN